MSVAIPLENIPTSDLVEELNQRADFNNENIISIMNLMHKLYFPNGRSTCPGCYGPCGKCDLDQFLLLKANNPFEQEVLNDLQDTYQLMNQ